jgi:hypothetical protein
VSKRVSLFYDDGSKIDFNSEGDAVAHVLRQGSAGVVALHEEATPEENLKAQLEAQLKALKDGEPATGDPYRAEVDLKQGKKIMDRAALDKAVAEGEVSNGG